jgi:hypothetical protein
VHNHHSLFGNYQLFDGTTPDRWLSSHTSLIMASYGGSAKLLDTLQIGWSAQLGTYHSLRSP